MESTQVRADQIRVPWLVGDGVFGATWPFTAAVDNPSRLGIIQGTAGAPISSTSPLVSFVNHADGELAANLAEVVVASLRSNGPASGVAIVATPQTAGWGGSALSGHMLMSHGTVDSHATAFPLWLSCQMWNVHDSCSNEINVVNESGTNPPSEGEYETSHLLNGLALIVGASSKTDAQASSAVFIGTQDTTHAPWQRGIDFQQDSVYYYPIVLPNNKPLVYRNAANDAKIAVVNVSNTNDVKYNTGGYYYWLAGATTLATLDNAGNLTLLGTLTQLAKNVRVYLDPSAQAVNNTTWTPISFNIETYDNGGFYDNATNPTRLTIPAGQDGRYVICASANFASNAIGTRHVQIYKNSSIQLAQQQVAASGTSGVTVLATVTAPLVAGDYVEVNAYQNSGGPLNVNAGDGATFVSMERL